MILKGKIVLVYDLEIFPNVFSCTIWNTERNEYRVYEISSRKNNLLEMTKLFKCKSYLFCGYNNIHYDNPVINYILENELPLSHKPYSDVCYKLHELSDTIINSDSIDAWKRWKYAKNFATLDLLTMLYSNKLRVGLKEMQITMQFRNVQEYDGDFNALLPESEIDKMLAYNKNDVESTTELLNRCEEDIKLRLAIEDEYHIQALNKDGVNLGMEILKVKYLEKTHKTWDDIKNLRSPCPSIRLNKIILPHISYKTPKLQQFLEDFKRQVVGAGRKAYEQHFLLDNIEYSVGVGGIHSVNTPEAVIAKDDEVISDVDVASLYPSLIIQYGFYPPHLGKEFLEIYTQIKNERIEAKHKGDKLKDKTLKLSINGLSGNLQSEYSWVYSPKTALQIRINGQLMLLMLAERLLAAGCRIIQANTDGLFVLRKKKDDDKFKAACKEWEDLTRLTLEEDRFERFYQYAINDYLAITEGYAKKRDAVLSGETVLNKKGKPYTISSLHKDFLKKKGMFTDSVTLGKGMAPMIIPKAINDRLSDNVSVEKTIKESTCLNDFITYQKVGKEFSVEYDGKLITRINRYYMSFKAPYLYKCKVNNDGKRNNYQNILKASGVKVINNLDEVKEFPTDINYKYYVTEAQKIVNAFIQKQMPLFDYIN